MEKEFKEIQEEIIQKVDDQVTRAKNLLSILSYNDLDETGLVEALKLGKELSDEIKSTEFNILGLSVTQQYLIRFKLREKGKIIDDFMSIDFDGILEEINS